MSPWTSARSMSTTSELPPKGVEKVLGCHRLGRDPEVDDPLTQVERVDDCLDGRVGVGGEEQPGLDLVVAEVGLQRRAARRLRCADAAAVDRFGLVGQLSGELRQEAVEGAVKRRRE